MQRLVRYENAYFTIDEIRRAQGLPPLGRQMTVHHLNALALRGQTLGERMDGFPTLCGRRVKVDEFSEPWDDGDHSPRTSYKEPTCEECILLKFQEKAEDDSRQTP